MNASSAVLVAISQSNSFASGIVDADLSRRLDQQIDPPTRCRAGDVADRRHLGPRPGPDVGRHRPVATDDDPVGVEPDQVGKRRRRHDVPAEEGLVRASDLP